MGRMKSRVLMMLALLVFLLAPMYAEASWVFVSDEGESGWQTYSRKFTSGFTGTVGFVVSNEYDDSGFDSFLLLDNLSHGGGTSNKGFELGSYTGYTLSGLGGWSIETGPYDGQYWGGSWGPYMPTQGTKMSLQQSTGADTSAFLNYYEEHGFNGSILETQIVVLAGEVFTFNWAFMTTDLAAFAHDFSLVYFKDQSDNIVQIDGLGQLSEVPLPPSLVLLASGLVGLAGLRKGISFRRLIS